MASPATLAALLDPQTVVLAGNPAPLTGSLAPLLQERLRTAWKPLPGPDLPLRPGEYGTESAINGWAFMLADRVFGALSPPSWARP